MEIELFYNEPFLKYGIKKYVTCNLEKSPHIIIFGNTGSGKTYATKLVLARISKKIMDSQFHVADYKGDSDFDTLRGMERFYRYSECEHALDDFYLMFQKRMSGEDSSRNFRMLYFDEWTAYLLSLDKKKAEEEKKRLGAILCMGRSYNVHIFQSMQRCDSSQFSAGSRDQYNVVIALGNLSTEGKDMMFREYKDKMKSDRKQGMGYMTMNNMDFIPIQVPTISNMELVNKYIKDAVCR